MAAKTKTREHKPIMDALDEVLTAMRATDKFRSVPNGRVEVGWIEARKCFQVTLDFRLAEGDYVDEN